MDGKAKVFIACCNRLLRESIARILRKKTSFEIAAAQPQIATFRDELVDSDSDVLVLDSLDFLLANPGRTSETPSFGRSLACVLIAMADDPSRFLTAIRRGARGYVLQDASAADVVSAVRTVAEGQVVCPPGYTRVLFDFVAAQSKELPDGRKRARWGLTRREQELVPLIGRGLSNKEIGNYLGVSEQTVKNHIHRILRKVGVSNRLSIFDACQTESSLLSTKDAGYSV
jgi:DNA-binding NarL/FixJ family response regulator